MQECTKIRTRTHHTVGTMTRKITPLSKRKSTIDVTGDENEAENEDGTDAENEDKNEHEDLDEDKNEGSAHVP